MVHSWRVLLPSEGSSLGKLLIFWHHNFSSVKMARTALPPTKCSVFLRHVCSESRIFCHRPFPVCVKGLGVLQRLTNDRLWASLSAVLWDLGKLLNLSESQFPLFHNSNLEHQSYCMQAFTVPWNNNNDNYSTNDNIYYHLRRTKSFQAFIILSVNKH